MVTMNTCGRLRSLDAAHIAFKACRREQVKDGGMCRVASLFFYGGGGLDVFLRICQQPSG